MRIDLTNIQINPYRLIPLALILWPAGGAIADHAIASVLGSKLGPIRSESSVASKPVAEGSVVAGYEVTSGYGMDRVHPVNGGVESHYGVDLSTPTGTELLAPTDLEVNCWWDNGGGGLVATVTPESGQEMKMLHLSFCTPGRHEKGKPFALTGNTGTSTGPHLDIRRVDKNHPKVGDVEPYLTGELSEGSELSDQDLTCAIGAAEGTRDQNCKPNEHYEGHVDPGNGAANQGSFSYQHGARDAREADQKQLERLRLAEKGLQAQAVDKFGRELSITAIAAALDLWNQSPGAGDDFVSHLSTATPTEAQIIEARSKSYVNPNTGELDAPGLGNDPDKVEADQSRRTGEVMDQLDKRNKK